MLTVKIGMITGVFVASIVIVGFFIDGRATASTSRSDVAGIAAATPAPGDPKTFSAYKGVAIGDATAVVRQKLGTPKEKSDAQDFYIFSNNETAQFYYDGSHTVTAIMITFSGNLKDAPTPLTVFGEDATPNPDGSIFKMVRYPTAGYWISYSRSEGSDAVISIAIQKI